MDLIPDSARHNQALIRVIHFAHGAFTAVGQRRKFTNLPYITHCLEILEILERAEDTYDTMRYAAILHDCVEDTAMTPQDITDNFGERVADLVEQVTDIARPEDGVRAVRIRINIAHLMNATPEGKTIKLADIISNCSNIVAQNRKFASMYLPEKLLTLEALKEGDRKLWLAAKDIIDTGIQQLKEEMP
jgi:(p)ppGpp synthase/HD superfamily hydrolase